MSRALVRTDFVHARVCGEQGGHDLSRRPGSRASRALCIACRHASRPTGSMQPTRGCGSSCCESCSASTPKVKKERRRKHRQAMSCQAARKWQSSHRGCTLFMGEPVFLLVRFGRANAHCGQYISAAFASAVVAREGSGDAAIFWLRMTCSISRVDQFQASRRHIRSDSRPDHKSIEGPLRGCRPSQASTGHCTSRPQKN